MSSQNSPYWKFTQYPLDDRGAIDNWRKREKKYDDFAENDFRQLINVLGALKKELWLDPQFNKWGFKTKPYKKMAGWKDIGELRFTNAAGTPIRVFGYFDEDRQEFVMLAGATHDGKKYDPSDIYDICSKRKKQIEHGKKTPIDFDFSNDEEEEESDEEYFKALFGYPPDSPTSQS